MIDTLYFHHYNDYSGSTKVLADYLSSTYDDLQEVLVITDNSKQGFLTGLGIQLINVPIFRINGRAVPVISQLFWIFAGLMKALKYGKGYKSFYINTIIPMYAALAGVLMKKKIIYHVHEKYVTKSLKSILAEYVFNHVKAERRFVSKYVANMYNPRTGCQTIIQYNKLSDSFTKKVKIRPINSHGYNEIIMIASLQKGKGVDNFLRLSQMMEDLHFTLIVSSTEERIKQYFNSELPPNISILPKQSDIHPYLYKSDVLLNLSLPFFWVETFGMTIIEGMAYGLPAIVPNVGGPIELVENGYNGFSLDVSNIELVANKIREILVPTQYNIMHNNALQKVQQFVS